MGEEKGAAVAVVPRALDLPFGGLARPWRRPLPASRESRGRVEGGRGRVGEAES